MVGLRTLAFLATLSLLLPKMKTHLPPRPICASQIALASYACAILPPEPPVPATPPPAPPSPPSPPDDGSTRHHHPHRQNDGASRHRIHRRRQHRHRHHGTSMEENCCRWLQEVDTECVCELLVRLPEFLSRPMHQYSVAVGSSCNATYNCRGRIKI